MKKISLQLLLSILCVVSTSFIVLADPVISLNLVTPTVVCSTGNDTVRYTVAASEIPASTNIVIYQSKDSTFNPYLGQGDSIGFIPGSSIPKDTINFGSCIKTLGIFIDACGAAGLEAKNEYMILTSGSGIKVSNLAINFDPANSNSGNNNDNDINIGTNSCGFKIPNATLISNLQIGSCNASNIISASPTDSIPPNAIILCFTSNNVTANYIVNGLCNLGYPIYVVQSSCTRTIGAFTNAASCSSTPTTRYRKTIAIDKRQNCQDNFVYDRCGLFDKDGTYAIRQQGTDTARVSNNGIRRNAIDSCGGIDYTQINFTADTTLKFRISPNFCNDGFHYIKAVIHPNGRQPISNTLSYKLVCNDVSATSTTSNICSGENALVDITSTDPNAIFSWTVSGGANITGASAGTGNQINQTLTYTGATNSNLTYNITSNDAGCLKTTSVNVIVKKCDTCELKTSITGNTTICKGATTTLTAVGEFDSVRWSNSATTTSIDVAAAGTYSVVAFKGACNANASVIVTENIIPVRITGNDVLCGGTNGILTANGTFDSVRWNTNETTTSITIFQSGNYSVTAYSNGCSGVASFEVARISLDYFLDKKLATICDGDTATFILSAGDFGSSPVDTFKFTQPGKFLISYQTPNCGLFTDSVVVTRNVAPTPFTLGNDTAFCGNFTKVLSTGNQNTQWNTEVTGAQITVTEAGQYIATVSNTCGIFRDTIFITQNPIPNVFIGNDTVFCEGELVLSVNNGDDVRSILWSTGNESATIAIETIGTYSVRVTNISGCTASDTINIKSNCSNDIWLPNAFSPNNDGINDVFYVRANPNNTTIERFIIFNRWGNKVFEADNILPDDITAGWDGTYKGKVDQLEVYGYEVIAKFSNGEKRTLKGNVTLIK